VASVVPIGILDPKVVEGILAANEAALELAPTVRKLLGISWGGVIEKLVSDQELSFEQFVELRARAREAFRFAQACNLARVNAIQQEEREE
jgi:hypothetical protein